MKLILGSDHAGFEAKEHLKKFVESKDHEVLDAGTFSSESCHYPEFAVAVAGAVAAREADRGILVCGTAIGMSIAANKVPGIRAAVCYNVETARQSRAHTDANVLCMGALLLDFPIMEAITEVWLKTPFDGGRHALRVEMIRRLDGEREVKKPPEA